VADVRKRILVAEDDPTISTMLERVLRAEFDVTVTADGQHALAAAQQLTPHLMLLDVMMPGLDGLEVARRARELPNLKRVPIIFLTAKSAPLDVVRGIQHGAKHYIIKPFKIDDVLEKVRKAVS
jgi:DNA-binding response OmpR family regulator